MDDEKPAGAPPPTIRPIPPPRAAVRRQEGGPAPGEPRRGFPWAVVLLLALVLLAAAVLLVLPRWAARRTAIPPVSPADPAPAAPAPAPPRAASPRELRERAYLESRADEAAGRASDLRERLERRGVELWGDDDYPAALDALARGEELLGAGDARGAERAYGEAVALLESVDGRSAQVLRDTLADGRAALDGGDAVAAGAAFSLALRIAPDSQAAATGLRRAEVLDSVLELLAEGGRKERGGDLEGAAAAYGRATALDPFSPPAQEALARVQARRGDDAFAAAMSRGLAALGRGDHAAAQEAFREAGALKPGSPQAAEGLAQAREAERLEAIAGHRKRAAALEEEESWEAAAEAYAEVLALAPAARFAQEGRARARARGDLAKRIDYHRAHPERFVSDQVLEEASSVLLEAEAAQPAGPRHRAATAELAEHLAVASQPVRVRLESDDRTEVTIYHVGRLGTFLSRELELRPGTYTVVGSRPGYRDVRRELVVPPGAEPSPLMVRCEEKV